MMSTGGGNVRTHTDRCQDCSEMVWEVLGSENKGLKRRRSVEVGHKNQEGKKLFQGNVWPLGKKGSWAIRRHSRQRVFITFTCGSWADACGRVTRLRESPLFLLVQNSTPVPKWNPQNILCACQETAVLLDRLIDCASSQQTRLCKLAANSFLVVTRLRQIYSWQVQNLRPSSDCGYPAIYRQSLGAHSWPGRERNRRRKSNLSRPRWGKKGS